MRPFVFVAGFAWILWCLWMVFSEASQNPDTGGAALLFALLALFGLAAMFAVKGES